MVIDQHVLVCLQIEVRIVLRILAETDRAIFVHNAAYLHDVSCAQLAVILVANNLDFLAYTRIFS